MSEYYYIFIFGVLGGVALNSAIRIAGRNYRAWQIRKKNKRIEEIAVLDQANERRFEVILKNQVGLSDRIKDLEKLTHTERTRTTRSAQSLDDRIKKLKEEYTNLEDRLICIASSFGTFERETKDLLNTQNKMISDHLEYHYSVLEDTDQEFLVYQKALDNQDKEIQGIRKSLSSHVVDISKMLKEVNEDIIEIKEKASGKEKE